MNSTEKLRKKLAEIRELHADGWLDTTLDKVPELLSICEHLLEGLEKIGYTQDVSPADPETGGPCRLATAMSRNRRILEAQEALEKASKVGEV